MNRRRKRTSVKAKSAKVVPFQAVRSRCSSPPRSFRTTTSARSAAPGMAITGPLPSWIVPAAASIVSALTPSNVSRSPLATSAIPTVPSAPASVESCRSTSSA